MKIPITRYGVRELVAFAGGFGLLALAAWLYLSPWIAMLPLALLVFTFSFFRDPQRKIPADRTDLLAPADGHVSDITPLGDDEALGGPAMRVGIFLSVFNVHVNRSPCRARVEGRDYRRGKFLDARDPRAGSDNESLSMQLFSQEQDLHLKVIQIAGLIARRIVCTATVGSELDRGERYGMIKFGSRTELIVPADRVDRILVKKGQAVKAGITPLIQLNKGGESL